MIINGIEITKFKWNDAEVSEEDYLRLNAEHREFVEKLELEREKKLNETPSKSKSKSKSEKRRVGAKAKK
jgi:hypothetical protein